MVRTDDKGVTALRDRRFYLKLSGSCSQSVSTKRLQLLGSLEKHGNSDPGNSAVHPTEASAYNFQPIDMNRIRSAPLTASPARGANNIKIRVVHSKTTGTPGYVRRKV